MSVPTIDGLSSLSDDTLRRFRERVGALGYRPDLLAEAESVAPGQLDAVSLALVRWELAHRSDAAGRVALLLGYGDAVERNRVEIDLGSDLVTPLLGAGFLVATREGALVCPFRVVPLDGLLVLGDEPSAGPEAVMGPGPTTLELASQLPLSCTGPALDIGTGAGTLALVLAKRGACPVVGTDINPRATALGAFNARLNGLAVDFRTGDLDAPVQGERFAWVVSQPAYVLRPEGAAPVTFLHGGRRGDELALRLLGRTPALLAAAGTALLLFDTPVEPGKPVVQRVRAALGDAPLDALVLAAPGPKVGPQAVAYAALAFPTLGPSFDDMVRLYRDHLARLGLTEWTHALVVLQAMPGLPAGGRYTAQLQVRTLSQAGPAALATLLGALEVAVLPDDELVKKAVALQPRAKLVEERPRPEADPVREVHFRRGAFGTERTLTDAGLALLVALEEAPDVSQAVERYAELCGAAPAEVRDTVLGFVREGLGRGLLVPRLPVSG